MIDARTADRARGAPCLLWRSAPRSAPPWSSRPVTVMQRDSVRSSAYVIDTLEAVL